MHLHHRPLEDRNGGDGFVFKVAALRDSDNISPNVITGPLRADQPRYPRWMAEGVEAPPGGPGRGQKPLFPESGTLPTWTKVVSGLGLMGMLYSMDHWARPTLKASKLERKGDVWGLFQKVVDTLGQFLNHGTNYIGHEVSKGAAHAAHGPARTIGLGALRWEQLTWHLAYFVHEMELVTGRLVHHVIPRQINRQTRPLRARTRRLEKGQTRQIRKTNALRRWTHTEIVRHIKPEIHHLERVTTKTLPQRIHREEIKRGKLQTKVRRDHKILMKLLPLLTVAGAAAFVVRAFGRLGLNFLRCQNVKGVGEELCKSPPGSGRRLGRFLRGILSGLGGFLAPLFVCQLFEAAVVLIAPLMSTLVEVVGVAGSALCDGKHSAAPPLSLNAAALPPVRNGIPL